MFEERRKEYENLLFYLEGLCIGYRLTWRGNVEKETIFEWDLTLSSLGEDGVFTPEVFIQHKWDSELIAVAPTIRMKPYTIKNPTIVRTVSEEHADGSEVSVMYKYGKGIENDYNDSAKKLDFNSLKDLIARLIANY